MDRDILRKDIHIENMITVILVVGFMPMEQPWTLQNGEIIHGLSKRVIGQWYGDL